MELSNNTILITGGSAGIGLELAKRLIKLGNIVIITGRNPEKLARTKKELPGLHTFQSDVSDPVAIKDLFNRVTTQFPTLNMLINNAGVMKSIDLQGSTETLAEITREIEINLNGPIRMVQQFLSFLKKNKNPTIVNVSSGLAFVPLPMAPVYSSTKAALHSYTLSLRVQLKPSGVRVFELAPPATKTELLDSFGFDDGKGATILGVEEMVNLAIKGFERDVFEIRPGQSNALKIMSRLAPEFILKQLSKSLVPQEKNKA
jgi:uncharacterized oxidoreductase